MSKFYDDKTGRIRGNSDDLIKGFFSESIEFGAGTHFPDDYGKELNEIERGLANIVSEGESDDLETKVAGGRNQKDDFERFFSERESKRDSWAVEEFLRAVENHFEEYNALIRERAAEIRERRERERDIEKEARRIRDTAERIEFQHKGGRPDFLPKNSVQTSTGTWLGPDGKIYRRITTHEWSDGSRIWDDRILLKQTPYDPTLGGTLHGYHHTPWGAYIGLILAIVVVLLILSALGVQFSL